MKMRYVFALLLTLVLLCATALAVEPRSVSFSEHLITIDLAENNTCTIKGTVYPEGASQKLNWYSSNDTIVTVNGGKVTALRTGEAYVRANVPGISAIGDKCLVRVTDSRIPTSLEIQIPEGAVEPGTSVQLTVKADNPNAYTDVRWQSSDIRIASVDENGVLTAVKPGSCTVYATSLHNKSVGARAAISISYKGLTVYDSSITGAAGGECYISYAVYPEGTSRSIGFISTDSAVATADETGLLTFKHLGECDITVRMNGYPDMKSVIHVTVTDDRVPDSLTVYPSEIRLEPGTAAKIEAVALPVTQPSVFRFHSSNNKIATVDDEGVVTAVGTGECVIRVYSAFTDDVYADVPLTAKYKGKIKSLRFSEDSITLQKGDTFTPEYITNPSDGSRAIKLSSSDESIVKVNYDGSITALGRGEATLTAYSYRDTSLRTRMKVTVEDISFPTAIEINPAGNILLGIGESCTFGVNVVPVYADAEYTVTNSRPDIIALEGTTLTALCRGVSDVTVTSSVNPELSVTFRVTAQDSSRTLEMPLRRTDKTGVEDNLARIENVKRSAAAEIGLLYSAGVITEAERKDRLRIIDNAFEMYAFPWTVSREQRYWSAANSQDGAKNFKPGIIYYGLPYVSGISSLRAFSVKNALEQGRYLPVEGESYYMLNQDNPAFGTAYVGNDCSSFIALCLFENIRYYGDIIKTSTLYFDERLEHIDDEQDLRPGDILVKHSSHVVMFLYWADEAHTQAVFIEQGGSEYAINTISASVYELSYYTEDYYRIRRLRKWGENFND